MLAICPNRFLGNEFVIDYIAGHHFGDQGKLFTFKEVTIPGAAHLGRFDYVLSKYEPERDEVDFIVVEFQSAQTTSTGHLVQAMIDFTAGKDIVGGNYQFGLNMADIWKRTFTQVLIKGTVMEKWNRKIYWIVQSSVFQNLVDRYRLETRYSSDHANIFVLYDLVRSDDRFHLTRVGVTSSSVSDMLRAFSTNLRIQDKQQFERKLTRKMAGGGNDQGS